MKKYNLKNDTMNESDLQRVYKFRIYPKDSKLYSDKRFINLDNVPQGGTHWPCFYIKITDHTTLIRLVDNQINFS